MIDLSHVSFQGVPPKSRSPLVRRVGWSATGSSPLRHKPATVHPLATWILAQAGVEPGVYRPEVTERRVAACLRRLRVATPEAAQAAIAAGPQILEIALDALLIGVSSFFRDPVVFNRLANTVLPALLARHGGLRVYSAGASTGEELYSIAFLLDELGALHCSELLGVDCRPLAVRHAGAGLYEAEEIGMLDERHQRKFAGSGPIRAVSQRIRERIRWRCANLVTFLPEHRQHLILFRNVAIYLRPEAAMPIWGRLAEHLEIGGVLVTGKGEQPPASVPLVRLAPSIYRRI